MVISSADTGGLAEPLSRYVAATSGSSLPSRLTGTRLGGRG